MIEPENKKLSISRQCQLLGLSRSTYYSENKGESEENLAIMRELDKQYLDTPFYGVERMWAYLRSIEHFVNIKRVRRLLRKMGLEAIYPKPNLSRANKQHKIYPYLLKGQTIDHINQVWSIDITYVPMKSGYMYLVAIIDWHSRFVLSWKLSNTLDTAFCVEALQEALKHGKPEVFNTDQGSQFTSNDFTDVLLRNGIKISMDGRGRATDNIFIERLWRSVKYENIYLHAYEDGKDLYEGLKGYFEFYNTKRPHSSLKWQTPYQFHNKKSKVGISC